MIKAFFYSLLTLFIYTTFLAYEQKGLFIGSIQFPSLLDTVPNIRVYYAGRTMSSEIDDHAKKVTFSVPEFKQKTFFYLLVTPEVEFALQNTVPFLSLKKNIPYKFFALQRVAYEPQKRKRSDPPIAYGWVISELSLAPADGRIPDETIIICYNPTFIEGFQGGNIIEFPKLVIRKDILKLVGSESRLHAISNQWLVSALTSDIIHSAVQTEFALCSQPKTVIAIVA